MECHSETHLMELSQQRWVINLMDPTRLFHSRWSQPRSRMAYGDGENLRKILHIYELLLFHDDWLKSMKYLPPKPATINSDSIPGRSHNGPDFWGIFFVCSPFRMMGHRKWWMEITAQCFMMSGGAVGPLHCGWWWWQRWFCWVFFALFVESMPGKHMEYSVALFPTSSFCSRFWRWYCLLDWLIGIYMIRPIRRVILLVVISANGKPSPCKLPS